MKKTFFYIVVLLTFIAVSIAKQSRAQGIHFSQYYHAPLLLNPANTGLSPENDYRVGVNYRKQWASIPVPYNTFSLYGDFQLMRNRNETNWMGVGFSFWNDKVGDGDLKLTKFDVQLAYHVQMGEYSMLSGGVSVGYAERSVDFSKFSFGQQWDGFIFNQSIPSGESGYFAKSRYADISVGINYAIFPNENLYLKIGLGMAHINQPKESFYGQQNKIGARPTANIDALIKLSEYVVLNPSLYYTTQSGASELLYGTLFGVSIGGGQEKDAKLLVGAFHRYGDAAVAALGLKYQQWKLMTSYDITMSTLAQANKGRGAFEMGFVFEALYNSFSKDRRTYNCPRF